MKSYWEAQGNECKQSKIQYCWSDAEEAHWAQIWKSPVCQADMFRLSSGGAWLPEACQPLSYLGRFVFQKSNTKLLGDLGNR